MLIVFIACGQGNKEMVACDIGGDCQDTATLSEVNDNICLAAAAQSTDEADSGVIKAIDAGVVVNAVATVLTDEGRIALRQRIFIGEGKMISGDDKLAWFYRVFYHDFYSISGFFIDFVGINEFVEWTQQFIGHGVYGWRDRPRLA